MKELQGRHFWQALCLRFLPHRRATVPTSVDPSRYLFGRIRRSLTFWYTGVLAGALLIFGVLLYVGANHLLLDPIDNQLITRAQQESRLWQAIPDRPCPVGFGMRGASLWACYDVHGTLLASSYLVTQLVPSFTSSLPVAITAPSSGQFDTMGGGADVGTIRRYTLVVSDPQGSVLGVIQFGELIDGPLSAIHILVILLLIAGGLALVVAVLGGLLLSNRALAPARLAMARQQAFIADASHELRTPLTLLRADAEVLLLGRGHLEPDDVELIEDMVAETATMSDLVSTLLTLARLDAGRLQIEHDVVDLAQVATDVIRRVRPLASERDVTLKLVDTATAASGVLVIGDSVLLERVILILVDNAIKYNRPGGRVSLQIDPIDPIAPNQTLRLAVRDTGIGIAAEHLPHLGERFYRVDKARSREDGGVGLGLSIARSIALMHGGTLELSSRSGEGTTATLTLPSARSGSQTLVSPQATHGQSPAASRSSA